MATTFSENKVSLLRKRAQRARKISEGNIHGWSKSLVDPMKLLEVFTALYVREGYILRAYIYRAGGDGNAIIWALPVKADFPEPDNCAALEEVFLSPPKPSDAIDKIMAAIDGDRSPFSYLSASIFAREAAEFGALWHGCIWSDVQILAKNPWTSKRSLATNMFNPAESDLWVWNKDRPHTWAPTVEDLGGIIKVAFITFGVVGQQTINRYTDTYADGKYTFKTEFEELAHGPGGITY